VWQQKFTTLLHPFAITQTQFALLASLRWFAENHHPTSQADLVIHTKIDKMTVPKALRKLEKKGLVVRQLSPTDSRAKNVACTAKGTTVIRKAVVAIETADDAFFSGLTPHHLEIYKTLTKSLISANEQKTAQPSVAGRSYRP